jgi:hypothetical protein
VGSAFAKGKEILMSVVKRYKRHLLGQQQQQQQQWSSPGSKRHHSSNAPPKSPHDRSGRGGGGGGAGVFAGGGRAGRLMLGVLMVSGVGLVALCNRSWLLQQHAQVLVLLRR